MQFVGAAQQTFSSFLELVKSMMDTYWPNWNNSTDRKSYILPPVCSFKNADLSDEDIEKIKNDLEQKKQSGVSQNSLSSAQRLVIDRFSDSGEFVVFYAVWALIQDEVQAPFLAIHGLNLAQFLAPQGPNLKNKCYLQQIFPNVKVDIQTKFEAMWREYDFVLIGPKIGIIIIEVKSSAFTKANDFAEKNKQHLPQDITKALQVQLGSFDPSLFHMFSGSAIAQNVPIRKILFTPNLEKRRFESWLCNLDYAYWKGVMDKFVGVTHWFNEDMANQREDGHKPPLYSTLRQEIEKVGYEMSHEIFESYGLITSGLCAAFILQTQTTVSIDNDRLSTSSAILNDAAALESHDPKRQNLDKTAPDVVELQSKLVLLTPEQQVALNGPYRQFIIGPPGTGKTILLQAKAVQLLKEGKKVLIFTKSFYVEKYKELFDGHPFCKILTTDDLRDYYYRERTGEWKEKNSDDETEGEELDPSEYRMRPPILEYSMGGSMVREDLEDYDCFLIDDVFDGTVATQWKNKRFDLLLILVTAITRSAEFRSKLVWVACDPYFDLDEDPYRQRLKQIIAGEQGDFCSILLNRVMRSSERVFHATYSPEVIQQLEIKPVIGHKIPGFCSVRLSMTRS